MRNCYTFKPFFHRFCVRDSIKKILIWPLLLCCFYVSSLLLILSAKWRCPSIDCTPFGEFFHKDLTRKQLWENIMSTNQRFPPFRVSANWRCYYISKETSVTCNKFESFKEILLLKYPWICFHHAFQVFDIDRSYSNVWSYGKIIANNPVDFIAKKNCALNVS